MAAVAQHRLAGATEEDGLPALLERTQPIIVRCVDPQSPILDRWSALRKRLRDQRLQIAVLGQFKRGKSTLLNALLGAPLMPASIVPLTAIPTFIAWGAEPSARISFADDKQAPETCRGSAATLCDFLFRFVAEEANPINRLGVTKVELFYPSPLLANGVALIDTPGVGSTFQHNTETALRTLSESDVALFVVGADPPITEVELDYLEQLKSKVARVFIVVNKIDPLAPEERERLAQFLRKVLQERSLLGEDDRIFQLSARQALAGKLEHDPDAVERSGLSLLDRNLAHYLARDKAGALTQAVAIKADAALRQAMAEAALRLRALRMPLEALESKVPLLKDVLRDIEAQRRVTRDLLAGDKRRLLEALEARCEELRSEARACVIAVANDTRLASIPREWEIAANEKIAILMQQKFERARERIANQCAADADRLLTTFQTRVDELIAAVHRMAARLFDLPIQSETEQDRFTLGEDPYWVTEPLELGFIPRLGRVFDLVLPSGLRLKRLQHRLIEHADELVIRNVENLRWALVRGFDETFRQATGHIEDRLDEAIAATRRIVETVLAERQRESFATDPQIAALEADIASLTDAHGRLAAMIGDDAPVPFPVEAG